MVLSPNSEIHPMQPSVKVSLIVVAIATIGIGGIAKMVSASPNTSLVAVAQEKIEPHTNQATEGAKISASLAQKTAEAAEGNKTNNLYAYTGEELAQEAKVSLAEARKIALKAHPGKITDQELEKESGGSRLRYSFDIKQGKITYEVGVDAKTGKLLENAAEGKNPDWQPVVLLN